MLAVDTDVLVRLIVADDASQAGRARALFERNRIFVGDTVLLETEWVLRSSYALPRAEVHAHLLALAGLPQVELESPERIARALAWYGRGMDFADALHLAGCGDGVSFATFDRRLAAAARKAGASAVKVL